MSSKQQLELLSKYFGSYKAEWLQDSLFELYSEPLYFPELTTPRPCVLKGNRGTGKTTVLKSLSYQGQWEIIGRSPSYLNNQERINAIRNLPYYGFYYRVSTPRVSAFSGDTLKENEWQDLFLHYINIIFAQKLFVFLIWYTKKIDNSFSLDKKSLSKICKSLCIDQVNSIDDIEDHLTDSLIDLETYINNIGSEKRPTISSAGTLDSIFKIISKHETFKNKTFFLIIDEYENLRDEQQQVVNTLIKHTTAAYTFKIGVRQLGWRIRHTLNEAENLISPADYVLIDIENRFDEEGFSKFAEEICNSRITKIFEELECDVEDVKSIKELLVTISSEREAEIQGISEITDPLRKDIKNTKDSTLIDAASQLKDLELYVIKYIADGKNEPFLETFKTVPKNENDWKYKFNEYRYASLFTIRARKIGIKKYYAGWGIYTKLAAKNIRYLLELVERALILHLKEGKELAIEVDAATQTNAAIAVGRKNLEELDGLSTYGAKLTKLVLGLGRIFGVLASDSTGHAHEVNQFRIRTTDQKSFTDTEDWLMRGDTKASSLINAAVMHLAVIPFPGNKPKDEGETKDNTYQLHPIFAPYFVFSHRKRRNLLLNEDQIIGLLEDPRNTIKKVLEENNRIFSEEIPEQLKLFGDYYNAGN